MTISDPLAPAAPGPDAVGVPGPAPGAPPPVGGPAGPPVDPPGAAAPLADPSVQAAAAAPMAPPVAPVVPAAPAAPPAAPTPSPASHSAGSRSGRRSLEVLANVEMTVTVELGRTRMPVRQLLALSPGSVIELNRSANTPVDVFVNGTLFARAEVVVIDDEFGVRITDIVERDNDAAFERA
ncbi:MAG TPA: flagellar motor switch protein FliN [Acidimicrobiales bacterium]|nr:flagellar motor switch protein FliN [Acidimicrobiales bacterium]